MNEIIIYKEGNNIYIKSDLLHDNKGELYETADREFELGYVTLTRGGEILKRAEDIIGEIYKGFYWTGEVRQNKLIKLKKMINDLFVEQIKVLWEYDKERAEEVFGDKWIRYCGLEVEAKEVVDNQEESSEVSSEVFIEDKGKGEEDNGEENKTTGIIDRPNFEGNRYSKLNKEMKVAHSTIKSGKQYFKVGDKYYKKDDLIELVISKGLVNFI